MHDDDPIYISTTAWADLLFRLSTDDELRQRMKVKLCPVSGQVEEYMVADQLGGMLNVWPMKWRAIIDSGRETAAVGNRLGAVRI